MTTAYDTKLGLYIAGEWLTGDGRDTRDVLNPATGAGHAALPLVNAADLDRALDAAQRGFVAWRVTPSEKRAAILIRTAQLLRERARAGAELPDFACVGRVERLRHLRGQRPPEQR